MYNQTTTTHQPFASGLVTAWNTQATAVAAFFEKYTDADYYKPVAPGRNRPVYILGHLIAKNDRLMAAMGFGQKLYPELEDVFLHSPDSQTAVLPSLDELRQKWQTQQAVLTKHFNGMEADQWFENHSLGSVSASIDTKLNLVLAHTSHMSYHLGQLNLFPERKRLKYNPFRSSVSLNFAF